MPRRDTALDPLLIAAAAASGPHITRNHYHHDFFPGVMLPKTEGSWDWTKWTPESANDHPKRLAYVSRQAPRRIRFPDQATARTPPVKVKCMARTRIPTPHGPAFLHLYHNDRDSKEHLAIVIDPAQLSDVPPSPSHPLVPPIRSQSLDAVWSSSETEMDRITRGAYVGTLSSAKRTPSKPTSHPAITVPHGLPPPLIRVHSECFTGETLGSMRCDCGEQLDESMRLISQPMTSRSPGSLTVPGRGAVIYLRQEGRGIGLLSKIRAYNLQDMGHDTVTANLMLGHQADERGYEIACAILRDLGLGSDVGEGVRVLTNNPSKVQALEKEGIRVVERVPMVPRSWQKRQSHLALSPIGPVKASRTKLAGATLIGGEAVYGDDLEKYLRTKVLRMGHLLPLWTEDPLEC